MDDKVEALIQQFFGMCSNAWHWLCKTTVGFYKATGKAEFDCDFDVTVFLAFMVLFFMGSACWSASIAACRRHNAVLHFILGLLFPWIYPAIILFTLDIKGAKAMREQLEKEKKEAEEAEAERQRNIQLNKGDDEIFAAETESVWNQARFEKMARNYDGSLAGPWDVIFGGRHVRVRHILEAFPEVVSVEFEDDKGNMLKMRIPYAKIESWEKC